jgi:hypothetical protein
MFHKNKKHTMNTPLIVGTVIIVAALLWSIGSWFVVRNIEEPSYTVVEQKNGYELRDYAPYIVAEVEVTGTRDQSMNQGFRLLADYIF